MTPRSQRRHPGRYQESISRSLVRFALTVTATVLLGIALVGWWAVMPFVAGRS